MKFRVGVKKLKFRVVFISDCSECSDYDFRTTSAYCLRLGIRVAGFPFRKKGVHKDCPLLDVPGTERDPRGTKGTGAKCSI
jgi:hypothetical protein